MLNDVHNYILKTFQGDSLVNTVTFNDNDVIDGEKENLYPLVAIRLNTIVEETESNLLLYNYKVVCLQKRYFSKIELPSKTMKDTNLIDNLAECESILINFLNKIQRLELNENINIQSKSELTPLFNYGGAGLDGFSLNIAFSFPNYGYC